MQIVSLDDRTQWEAVAAESGVPSHAWGFCRALAHSGSRPRLARLSLHGATMIVPFSERRSANTSDISTLACVSGATLSAPLPELLDAWEAHARAQGWVAGYLQFDPEVDLAGIPDAHSGNVVFLLDLGPAHPLAGASDIIRRKVRRADALGAALVEDRQQLADAVGRLHAETMVRTGAHTGYRYSDATLRGWFADPASLVLGAATDAGLEACVLFLFSGTRAEYHLGASTGRGRALQAWLIYQGLTRLQDLGVRRVNLGGGVRPGDGLFEFKARFGGEPRSLRVIRHIYHPEVYDQLCREADAPPGETWFPAYRARVARLGFDSRDAGPDPPISGLADLAADIRWGRR